MSSNTHKAGARLQRVEGCYKYRTSVAELYEDCLCGFHGVGKSGCRLSRLGLRVKRFSFVV